MNITLPSELAAFVEAEVAAGHYASSSDVVLEALRLLKRSEPQSDATTLDRLRRAWEAGIESGEAQDIDFEALKAEGRARLAALKA